MLNYSVAELRIMLFYSVLNKNKSYFFFKYSTNLATALAL